MENQGTRNGTLTGSKADNKKGFSRGTSFGNRICSDSGFIEVALKCKAGNHLAEGAAPSPTLPEVDVCWGRKKVWALSAMSLGCGFCACWSLAAGWTA